MRRGLVVLENRDDDELGGIHRVLRVLAKVDAATLRKVKNAQDHKGTLEVEWADLPTPGDMYNFEKEWEEENEYLLTYTLPDGREVKVQTSVTVRTPSI
jgi:hypothetical protein